MKSSASEPGLTNFSNSTERLLCFFSEISENYQLLKHSGPVYNIEKKIWKLSLEYSMKINNYEKIQRLKFKKGNTLTILSTMLHDS